MNHSADPILRRALIDSRERWRDLVTIAADLAYETDAQGRFVFVMPAIALGWPAASLVGAPAEDLLAGGTADGFNPFRITEPVRRRRAWFRQADGSPIMLAVSAMPLPGVEARSPGTRGIGVDWTALDEHAGRIAAALRRGEVLDHILRCTGKEVLAPRMMQAALDALVNALGAEGAAVIDLLGAGGAALMHRAGLGGDEVSPEAISLLSPETRAADGAAPSGRPVLVAACNTRFGAHTGLALWRSQGGRDWDRDDRLLMNSATNLIRMVLEHEAIQHEMVLQARTDPLTGLLNRRAFLDEMARHIDRLDREEQTGTLLFADLDCFKPVNDRLGHEIGDQVLLQTAHTLRDAVRPSDLAARLGGDEFALWIDGADHLTTAERAENLCCDVPDRLHTIVGDECPCPTISIGIATRAAGSGEAIDHLLRRADLAMYEAKRTGRGHWRVASKEDA
jgi:diguanylate cyclase (GGDEF)-like protein